MTSGMFKRGLDELQDSSDISQTGSNMVVAECSSNGGEFSCQTIHDPTVLMTH